MRKILAFIITLVILFTLIVPFSGSAQGSLQSSKNKINIPRYKIKLIYADWCPFCDRFFKETLGDKILINDLGNRYELEKINIKSEAGKKIFAEYGIKGFPTIMVFDPIQNLVKNIYGFRNKEQLRKELYLPDYHFKNQQTGINEPVLLNSTGNEVKSISQNAKPVIVLPANSLIACPAGKYESSPGICSDCPSGNYCPGGNPAPAPIACPVGTYNPNTGADDIADCLACQTGTYNPTTGSSACTACPIGTYNPNTGGDALADCLACPTGTFNGNTGSSACAACPAGTYNPNTGSNNITACLACPSGTYNGNTGSSACTACPVGTYNPSTGGDDIADCLTCPSGTFNGNTGSSACAACPAGTYNPSTGGDALADCLACPTGTFNGNPGSAACAACPAGTYNPNTGSNNIADCLACASGTYNGNSGSSACTACPIGTYNPNTGSNNIGDCLACPSGTFNSNSGSAACTACPAGTYNPASGGDALADCLACPAGTYNSVTGANNITNCLACPAGFYCPTASANPIPCPPGASCPAGSSNPVYPAVGIGTTVPHESALLDLVSTVKGLLLTRMDSLQRENITNPVNGLLVYQTDKDKGVYLYNGGWIRLINGLKKTETVNVPTINPNGVYSILITLNGAEPGAVVHASPSGLLADELVIAYSRVSAPGIVEVLLKNIKDGVTSPAFSVELTVVVLK